MTYRLELAEHFNSRVPVGTPVRYWPARGGPREPRDTVTRSEAWTLGDGEPVVLVDGALGVVSIDHVRVLPAQCHARGLEDAAGMAKTRGKEYDQEAREKLGPALLQLGGSQALGALAGRLRARAEAVRKGSE